MLWRIGTWMRTGSRSPARESSGLRGELACESSIRAAENCHSEFNFALTNSPIWLVRDKVPSLQAPRRSIGWPTRLSVFTAAVPSRHDQHQQTYRRRTLRPGKPGRGGHRPAGRGRDGSVHRALPQGSHRRPGRHPAAHCSKSGCATCASWRSGAPPILASIGEQGKLTDALRGADRRAPTPRRGWKTCICRTSRSAAPRRRSPAKRAWSRWPTALLANPAQDPEAAPAARSSMRTTAWPTPRRRSTARAQILMERFAEDAELLGALRELSGSSGRLISTVVEGKQERRREVLRLLRFLRAARKLPVAPRAGPVPRPRTRRCST